MQHGKYGTFLTVQFTTREEIENLFALKELVETGVLKVVIDKCYPLEEVPDAHHYVETGRKKEMLSLQWQDNKTWSIWRSADESDRLDKIWATGWASA